MKSHLLFCLFLSIFTAKLTFADKKNSSNFEFKIAFGSCGKQTHPLPIFNEVIKQNPNIFIFLGDNIYGDTNDMDILRKKYQELGNKESYKNLIKNTDVLATWDDHDYGQNDAGKHYPHKEESKEIFLEFFKEPKNSERYKHKGFIIQFIRKQEIKSFRSFSWIIVPSGMTWYDFRKDKRSRVAFFTDPIIFPIRMIPKHFLVKNSGPGSKVSLRKRRIFESLLQDLNFLMNIMDMNPGLISLMNRSALFN